MNILDSVKRAGNGLEILVELRNDNDIVLDVLICTGNKSSRCVGAVDFRDNISRVRINLVNVQALTFDEFRRYLAYDIDSKEWIYNRKEEAVKRTSFKLRKALPMLVEILIIIINTMAK